MMFSRFPDNQSSKCQVKTFVNLHIDVAAGARDLEASFTSKAVNLMINANVDQYIATP